MSTTNVRFQLRKDITANWTTVNPVLLLGEPGFEIDTRKLKIGTGQRWNDTEYVVGEGGLGGTQGPVGPTGPAGPAISFDGGSSAVPTYSFGPVLDCGSSS
jgi:hyaluronoglucosaminidase